MVNYNISFKKPFSDFRKLLIGIVVNIIPIVNLISYGYILESSDIKSGKQTENMVEWDDLGKFFIKGLLGFIISVIYAIPALIVGLIAFFVVIAPLIGKAILLGPERIESMNPDKIFPFILPYILTALPLMIIGGILLLVASYIAPVATLNYIKTDSFSEAFNFKEITKYIFTGDYLIVWALVLVLNIVLVGILSEIPFIGTAIGSFITGMIGFSLFAGVMIELDKKF